MKTEATMNKILLVSHCIINTACKVVSQNTEELRKEAEDRIKLLDIIRTNHIQLLQLPCPEFILYGARRWGHVKEQFSHPFYRKQCRELLEPVMLQIKEYASYPDRFELMAIVAIGGSPSCGYRLTCRGDWGGEFMCCNNLDSAIKSLTEVEESGVFIEELLKLMKEEQIYIPIMDLHTFAKDFYL